MPTRETKILYGVNIIGAHKHNIESLKTLSVSDMDTEEWDNKVKWIKFEKLQQAFGTKTDIWAHEMSDLNAFHQMDASANIIIAKYIKR